MGSKKDMQSLKAIQTNGSTEMTHCSTTISDESRDETAVARQNRGRGVLEDVLEHLDERYTD